VKGKQKADGIGAGDPDITRLDGPSANAIVAVLGAVSRSGIIGWTPRGVLPVRNMSSLGRPAQKGAGQDEANQEQGDRGSHRGRLAKERQLILKLGGKPRRSSDRAAGSDGTPLSPRVSRINSEGRTVSMARWEIRFASHNFLDYRNFWFAKPHSLRILALGQSPS
jgi:hypothetical protein